MLCHGLDGSAASVNIIVVTALDQAEDIELEVWGLHVIVR